MFRKFQAAALCAALAGFLASPAFAGGPATTTTLTSGAAFVGVPVTLTATITPPAAQVCVGNVTFQELPATALVCTGGNPAAVAGNSATCQTTFASSGNHSLRGNYGSTSGACSGSTGTTYVLNVGAGVPTLTQWGMLALIGGLLIAGVGVMARRSRALPPG